MHRPPVFAVLSAAVLLTATASAQNPLAHEATVTWPTSVLGAPNVLGRTVAVDASGDGHLDLFVRGGANGEKILYFDGVWQNLGCLATGISCADFDATRGTAVGISSGLAFVDGTGLRLLQRNTIDTTLPTTLSFAASSIDTTSGAWAGARMVRAGDLDATGSIDYVGVKADGQTLILRANGGPTNTEFNVGRTIMDIAVVQWSSSPEREIAVMTNNGVQIRLGNGTPTAAAGVSGYLSTAMAVLRVPGAVDRLAWVGTNGSSSTFALFGSAGTENFGTLAASSDPVNGLTTGDVDGDGDTDVVVRRANSPSHWLLVNSAPATWFSPGSKVDVGWTTTMTNSGAPILAKFSNHARADLVVPAYDTTGSSGEIATFTNLPVELLSQDVFLFENDEQLDPAPIVSFLDAVSPETRRELQFEVNFANENLAAPATGPDDRKIEVSVYVGLPGSNNTSTQMEARYWIPYPQASILDTRLYLGEILITAPQSTCALDSHYIEVRQIRVDGNNWITESMPEYTFGTVVSQAQYDQYPIWGAENADMLDNDGDPHLCQSTNVGAFHASAITRRRRPLPSAGTVPPVPVPLPATATTTPQ